MNLTIENKNGILVTTSNRVSEELGVRHDHLMDKIKDYISKFSSPETAGQFYIESEYKTKDGRTTRNYLITEKGIAQLIGGYSNKVEKAFELNVAYINEFQRMKEQLVAKPSIPNYSKKELLLLALEQIERIEALEAEQVINAPKLEYHDRVLNSDKLITTTEIAKDLGMSAIKLHLKLNELGIIYKRKKVWMFYSKYEGLIPTHADYRINEFSQVLCWTELGREWILEQIKTL